MLEKKGNILKLSKKIKKNFLEDKMLQKYMT